MNSLVVLKKGIENLPSQKKGAFKNKCSLFCIRKNYSIPLNNGDVPQGMRDKINNKPKP